MRQITKANCDVFARNVNTAKRVYWFDGSYNAVVFAASVDDEVPKEKLRLAKRVIEHNSAFLSALGDTAARIVVTSALVKSNDPQQAIVDIKRIYMVMKKHFVASEFLAYATIVIYESGLPAEKMATRTKRIYDLMRSRHFLMATPTNISVCAIMAVSGRRPELLIEDSEKCYRMISRAFISNNDALLVANMLALYDYPVDIKCKKLLTIRDLLIRRGLHLGTYNSSAILVPLAIASFDEDTTVLTNEVCEAEKIMSVRKATGGLLGVGKKLRTMFAVSVVNREFGAKMHRAVNAAASRVSNAIADEVAVLCCISACVASNKAAARA